jgi:TPR repeat protein
MEAQSDLGYCYFYGIGVREDHLKAVYWYKKAAKMNVPRALYNLGLCYKHGAGVVKSSRWAKHYFEKAQKVGYKKALRQLAKLS